MVCDCNADHAPIRQMAGTEAAFCFNDPVSRSPMRCPRPGMTLPCDVISFGQPLSHQRLTKDFDRIVEEILEPGLEVR